MVRFSAKKYTMTLWRVVISEREGKDGITGIAEVFHGERSMSITVEWVSPADLGEYIAHEVVRRWGIHRDYLPIVIHHTKTLALMALSEHLMRRVAEAEGRSSEGVQA